MSPWSSVAPEGALTTLMSHYHARYVTAAFSLTVQIGCFLRECLIRNYKWTELSRPLQHFYYGFHIFRWYFPPLIGEATDN